MLEKVINERSMRILLWLVALHSLTVGFLLMLLPPNIMEIFGYAEVNERFFQVQAGVFHIVMVTAYLMAAAVPGKRQVMVRFSYIVKFIATIFLFSYSALIQPILTVFLSGLADFSMGIVIMLLHRELLKRGLYEV